MTLLMTPDVLRPRSRVHTPAAIPPAFILVDGCPITLFIRLAGILLREFRSAGRDFFFLGKMITQSWAYSSYLNFNIYIHCIFNIYSHVRVHFSVRILEIIY